MTRSVREYPVSYRVCYPPPIVVEESSQRSVPLRQVWEAATTGHRYKCCQGPKVEVPLEAKLSSNTRLVQILRPDIQRECAEKARRWGWERRPRGGRRGHKECLCFEALSEALTGFSRRCGYITL